MFNRIKTIAAPFISRNPGLVFTASALSHFGDWFYMVALAKISYDAGGVMGVTATTIARYVPAVLLPPVAGLLADRLSPRFILIASDLIRAVLMGALAWIALTGPAHPVLIAGIVFLAGAAGAAFRPARMSLMPSLATPGELQALNAADGTVGTLALLVAPALGGLGLELASAGWLFLLDAASFVASAILLGLVKISKRTSNAETAVPIFSPIAALRQTAATAEEFIPTLLTYTASHFAVGATWVLLPVLALRSDPTQDVWIGLLTSAIGAGSVAGMILGGTMHGSSPAGRLRIACVAILCFGAAIAPIASLPKLSLVAAGLVLMGFFANLAEAPFWTHWQQSIPAHLRGRAFGWIDGISTAGMLLGSACAGLITQAHGESLASSAVGAVVATVSVTSLVLLSQGYKGRDMEARHGRHA